MVQLGPIAQIEFDGGWTQQVRRLPCGEERGIDLLPFVDHLKHRLDMGEIGRGAALGQIKRIAVAARRDSRAVEVERHRAGCLIAQERPRWRTAGT